MFADALVLATVNDARNVIRSEVLKDRAEDWCRHARDGSESSNYCLLLFKGYRLLVPLLVFRISVIFFRH